MKGQGEQMREGFAKFDKLDVVVELLTKLVQQSPNADATNDPNSEKDLEEEDTVNYESSSLVSKAARTQALAGNYDPNNFYLTLVDPNVRSSR